MTPSQSVELEAAVERLEPCPFCGGKPEIAMSEIPVERAVRIRCASGCCERIGRDDRPWAHNSEMIATERAVAAWNTRASNARALAAEEARELLPMLDDYFDRYIGATRGEDMSLEEMLISKARDLIARTTLASMKEKA